MKFQIRFNIFILIILAAAGISALYGIIRDASASSDYTVYPIEPNYSYYFSGYNKDYYMINESCHKGIPGSFNSYAISKSECTIPFNEQLMHVLDIIKIKIYSDDEILITEDVVQIQNTDCLRIINAKKIYIDMNSLFGFILIICIALLITGNIIIGLIRLIARLFRRKKE